MCLKCEEHCLSQETNKYDVAPPAVHSALSACVVGMQIQADECIWSGVHLKRECMIKKANIKYYTLIISQHLYLKDVSFEVLLKFALKPM